MTLETTIPTVEEKATPMVQKKHFSDELFTNICLDDLTPKKALDILYRLKKGE